MRPQTAENAQFNWRVVLEGLRNSPPLRSRSLPRTLKLRLGVLDEVRSARAPAAPQREYRNLWFLETYERKSGNYTKQAM